MQQSQATLSLSVPCFEYHRVFFFQAEDGIRDWSVTGVQTCALPIFPSPVRTCPARRLSDPGAPAWLSVARQGAGDLPTPGGVRLDGSRGRGAPDEGGRMRSEERRVGKEGRGGGGGGR